jgi:hypothetical protein
MKNLLAAILVASAALGMAGTSANAGIFSDAVKAVAAKRADDAARQRKAAAGGQYGYFADKPYMGCLQYMGSIARNEAERKKGWNICNKNYGYPYH